MQGSKTNSHRLNCIGHLGHPLEKESSISLEWKLLLPAESVLGGGFRFQDGRFPRNWDLRKVIRDISSRGTLLLALINPPVSSFLYPDLPSFCINYGNLANKSTTHYPILCDFLNYCRFHNTIIPCIQVRYVCAAKYGYHVSQSSLIRSGIDKSLNCVSIYDNFLA